ncbi:cobalt ECF transporter T component CbiQ [Methanosphaerula palustris]|uniref:Cobalt ABC transporter, inner membrane subunit CbiQ n=1 Tax=Methanosphaerula palustris (strain ATCC BAA-1556 / DSM 19958 / E1-9c) TaxID=521011 RepID=B8GEB5_METPE|nr:cobalt ECF transporter T component CbiQ [Methanosphaerula palustris]ACL17616.1 cobalt ABC transporter, inner membrane subunit CbiQ [Methanosphaerula palustris E1-9c]
MIETNLDSIAQQSAFRHIHPGTKLIFALGSLILCLISPSPVVPVISGIILSLVLIGPGRVSPIQYGKLLLGPIVFTTMSVVVLLFMLGGGDVIFRFNPVPWINLTITTGAVSQSLLVLCRVFGSSVSLFFITLTTPMTDLFNGMKRIGIPIELIDLMMIVYRYIFIIYDQAVEIWHAQVMRLGYSRPGEAVRSFSMLCGTLFISSWCAGEDLIHAMDCRCYDGIFPSLDLAEPMQLQSLVPVLLYLAGLTGILLAMRPWGMIP